MPAVHLQPGIDPYTVLESGNVLVIPEPPLQFSAADCELMQGVRLSGGYHKNIAYKPQHDKLTGLDQAEAPIRERLHAILRKYSESARACAARILPRYSAHWRLDYASFRPIEEAGRKLPLKKRNDLLHTDAFPTRPTRGALILRLFVNMHPSKSRIWLTSDPFEKLAPAYAAPAGLEKFARRKRLFQTALCRLGFPFPGRSAYDEFMLAFHDYLKRNAEFQSRGPKYRLEFAPGTAWMVFTDVVPHAVESGQFALEQTFIVPREALSEPARAPISVLEKLAGRKLA